MKATNELISTEITREDAIFYLRRAIIILEGKQALPPCFAPLNCDAMEKAVETLKQYGWAS